MPCQFWSYIVIRNVLPYLIPNEMTVHSSDESDDSSSDESDDSSVDKFSDSESALTYPWKEYALGLSE